MNKILAIIAKDVYATYTDRSLLLLMLATPLVLATIIALAFSDITGGGAPLRDIPVALVNFDEGANGAIFVNLLVPDADNQATSAAALDCGDSGAQTDSANGDTFLLDLTDAVLLNDADSARAGVDGGRYAAAIIIPADFSARMEFSPTNMTINPPPIEVYADSNRPISASVIQSVTEGIVGQMLVGQVAISATIQSLIAEGMGAQAMNLDPCVFTAAFTSNGATVSITQESIQPDAQSVNLLVIFGAAQAVFFAMFTANGSATNILEERRNGTFQRMMVSPTPRTHILLGKLLSTFANVILQLVLLFIAFMVVASLLEGELALIWGTNWLLISITLLVLALATSGIGMIVAAVARTPEQAGIVGSVIALFMGAAGGAFFQIGQIPPAFDVITRLSVVRWGQEAFLKLAEGNNDIALNLIALLVIGGLLFVLSAIVFLRRQDI